MIFLTTGSYLAIIFMLNMVFHMSNFLWFSYGTNGTVVSDCLAQLVSIHNARSANYLMAP